MDTTREAQTLEQYIFHLTKIENAINEYRSSGNMDALYELQNDLSSRPILQKWLAFANMPELDTALNAMHRKSVCMTALSPYRDVMLHCQTEWDKPVEFIHIVYVHKGCFRCTMPGETMELKHGWCYMFNVNADKTIYPDSTDAQLLNCLISQNYFENILLKTFDRTVFFSHFLTQAFYTVNSARTKLALDTSGNDVVRTIFSNAIVEQVNRNPLYETAVNSLVSMLMVELLRIYMEDSDTKHYLELGNNKLSDILDYIDSNCATVTLAEVANAFHFNPSYLSRIIKSQTGQTFTQVLQTIRLRKAALLLQSTSISVSDITNFVGYHNLTHFYRLFRESYGVSPAEYRESHIHASKYY